MLNPTYSTLYRRALTLGYLVFLSLSVSLIFVFSDRLEQLRSALDALPLSVAEVDAIVKVVLLIHPPFSLSIALQQVSDRIPGDRSALTLAAALAESSPAKAKPLDSKGQKMVRRWLDKRRHAYRERRATRVTKLLQDFHRSEIQYVDLLTQLDQIRSQLSQSGIAAEQIQIVFGGLRRLLCLSLCSHLVHQTFLARVRCMRRW